MVEIDEINLKMDIERPKIVQMLLQSIHAQHGSDVPKSFKLEPPNFVIQLRNCWV